MPPIGLITDLGWGDYYVGAMKGVILSINPEAKIVDISHQIPKHDVEKAAFVLCYAADTFPRNSVFIAVIDPGVGTERKCILLRTREKNFNFIGPDNGVFSFVADRFGVSEVREVSNSDFMLPGVSSTFHGRDIMAPAGAHISLNPKLSEVGPEIGGFEKFDIETPCVENGVVSGQIINIDDFGNLITNIPSDLVYDLAEFGDVLDVRIAGHEFFIPFVRTFGDVSKGEKLCYIGSIDTLEIAKNRGNLSYELDVDGYDKLNIRKSS